MRVFYLLFAVAAIAAGLMATIEVPNIGDAQDLLAQYRDNREATLDSLEAAIFQCIPETAESANGRYFATAVIAPFYLHAAKLRFDGVGEEQFRSEIQMWFKTHNPQLLSKLPDSDFLELVGYLEVAGKDDVENCMLAFAIANGERRARMNNWALRL